jgi:hypothetical protein
MVIHSYFCFQFQVLVRIPQGRRKPQQTDSSESILSLTIDVEDRVLTPILWPCNAKCEGHRH